MINEEKLKCSCGCGMNVTPELRAKLGEFEAYLKLQIIITSGARCQAYNLKVGGAKASEHLIGNAADTVCPGLGISAYYKAADKVGWERIGINTFKKFLHFDLGKDKPIKRFYYDEKGASHNMTDEYRRANGLA